MKTCKKCGTVKQLNEFHNNSKSTDGTSSICRCCSNKLLREYRASNKNLITHKYEKTINGFLMRLYRNMNSRINGIQKKKSHLYKDKELLNKEEFYTWAKSSAAFKELFKLWELSNHERRLTPSVDRVDSSKGYFVDNMEWVTHSENSRRGTLSKIEKYSLNRRY